MGNLRKRPLGVIFIMGFFILSSVFWIVGQGGAIVAYETVAELGLQHDALGSADPVIIEVNRGIAFGDVVIQLPFFVIGIIGLWRLRFYGAVASWMAMAIHLYWTATAWAKQYFYLSGSIKCEPFPVSLHGALAFFFLFSIWGSWYLFKKRGLFD